MDDHKDQENKQFDVEAESTLQADTTSVDQPKARSTRAKTDDIKDMPYPELRENAPEDPFLVGENVQEDVQLSSGGFDYTVGDLFVPGRNGLDLVLRRRYNHASSSDHTPFVDRSQGREYRYYWYDRLKGKEEPNFWPNLRGPYQRRWEAAEDAEKFLDGKDNSSDFVTNVTIDYKGLIYFTNTEQRNHNHTLYGLGYGWSFDLPSIETLRMPVKVETATKPLLYKKLHIGDGRAFVIQNSGQSGNNATTPSGLEGYYSDDMKISVENGYVLTFKDGKKYGFNGSGKLAYIADRFDNRIHFSFNGERLYQITDTFGATFQFDYDGNGLRTIAKVGSANGAIMTYQLSNGQLISAVNGENQATSYEYTHHKGLVRLQSRSIDDGVALTYNSLAKVKYYTGKESIYQYGHLPMTPNGMPTTNRQDTSLDVFPLTKRYDFYNNEIYNESSYGYTQSVASIHAGHYVETGTITRNGKINQFKFNPNGTCSKEEVTVDGKVVSLVESAYTTVSLIKKDEWKQHQHIGLPIQRTTYTYSSPNYTTAAMQKEDFTYENNRKGNLIQQKVVCTSSGVETYSQTTNFTYDPTFNMLTEKSYLKEAGVTIKEISHLREDKKAIVSTLLYENDVLKAKTEFIYNGNYVVQTKEYRNPHSADCVVKAFVYTEGTMKPFSVEISNIKDVDGNLVNGVNGAGVFKESFQYDRLDNVVYTQNNNGYAETCARDKLGRMTQKKDFQENASTVQYLDGERSVISTDENGNRFRYDYTPAGKVWRIVSLKTNTKLYEYVYNAFEQVSAEIAFAPNGSEKVRMSYSYDVFDRVLSKTVSGSGVHYQDTFSYSDAYENKYTRTVKTIHGDGASPTLTSVSYANSLGQVEKQGIISSGNEILEYVVFDKLGNKTRHQSVIGAITEWTHDFAGRVLSETNASQTLRTVYDALGNKLETIDYSGRSSYYQYDELSRPIEERKPLDDRYSTVRYYYYGAVLHFKKVQNNVNSWNTTEYTYDAMGRVKDVYVHLDGVGRKEKVSTSYYDKKGNITSSWPSRPSYAYNQFDQVIKTSRDGLEENCFYDATGALLYKTDYNKNRTDYIHDVLGRLKEQHVTVRNPSGVIKTALTMSYAKNGAKEVETLIEIKDGVVTNNVETNYYYNDRGQLQKQVETGGPAVVEKTYGYDNIGNRTSFALKKGTDIIQSFSYQYNIGLNTPQLVSVVQNGTVIAEYQYNTDRLIESVKHPSGHSTKHIFNKGGLITSLTNNGPRGTLSEFTYEYAFDGNQTKKASAVSGKTTTTTYMYDSFGRLTEEKVADGDTTKYVYDGRSNRIKMDVVGKKDSTTTYNYSGDNLLLKEIKKEGNITDTHAYAYDGNGNQVYRSWNREAPEATNRERKVVFASRRKDSGIVCLDTREYNGFNQLVLAVRDVEESSYNYRPDGLRHSKKVDNNIVFHLWDGQTMAAELNATGQVRIKYLRGAKLFGYQTDASLFFYLFNAHGDVVQNVSAFSDGHHYDYDAYGVEKNEVENDPNPMRYCGEYYDTELEEIYLRARSYNPRTGRFIQEDTHWNPSNMIYGDNPSKMSHGIQIPSLNAIIQSSNLYAYCMGNPISYIDETGEFVCTIIGGLIGGVIGGMTEVAINGGRFRDGFVKGAVSGAIIGMGADIIATGGAALPVFGAIAISVGAGSAGGALGQVAYYMSKNEKNDGREVGKSAVKGAIVSGAIGFAKGELLTKILLQGQEDTIGKVGAAVFTYFTELLNGAIDLVLENIKLLSSEKAVISQKTPHTSQTKPNIAPSSRIEKKTFVRPTIQQRKPQIAGFTK